MTKGGARARSGPPPDPNAVRRDRPGGTDGWVTLPAAGRLGPAPEWPLSEAVDRELQLWASEWARPQAVMWERNGQEVEVAMYVRSLVAAEMPTATAASRVLVLRQQEYLGLSTPGLHRNKWKIDVPAPVLPPAAPARKPRARKGAAPTDVRARMKVLNGGA